MKRFVHACGVHSNLLREQLALSEETNLNLTFARPDIKFSFLRNWHLHLPGTHHRLKTLNLRIELAYGSTFKISWTTSVPVHHSRHISEKNENAVCICGVFSLRFSKTPVTAWVFSFCTRISGSTRVTTLPNSSDAFLFQLHGVILKIWCGSTLFRLFDYPTLVANYRMVAAADCGPFYILAKPHLGSCIWSGKFMIVAHCGGVRQ